MAGKLLVCSLQLILPLVRARADYSEPQPAASARPAAARTPRGATRQPRRRAAWWTRAVSLPDASRASDRKD